MRSLEGNEWKCKKGTWHNKVEQGYSLGLAALFENCLYVCQLSAVSWPPSCHLEGTFPANFHSGLLCMRRNWTETWGGQVHMEQILRGACLQTVSWTCIQVMHIPICTVIIKDLGAGYTSTCSSLSSTASHVLSHLYLQGQQGVAGRVTSSLNILFLHEKALPPRGINCPCNQSWKSLSSNFSHLKCRCGI